VLLQTKPRGGAGVADVGLLSIITTKVWFGVLLCLALLFGCVFFNGLVPALLLLLLFFFGEL
jgi:hypothetical protein